MDLSKTNLFLGLCIGSTPLLFYFGNKILNTHLNVVNTHSDVLEIKKRLIQANVDSTTYSLDELHKLKKLQLNINDIDSKINALTKKIDFLSEKLVNVDSINLKVDALTQTTNSFSEKLIDVSQLLSYIYDNHDKLSLVKTKVLNTLQSVPHETVSPLIKSALIGSGQFDPESSEVLADFLQNTMEVIKASSL